VELRPAAQAGRPAGTRREFLRAAGGAWLASAACRRARARPPLVGGMVGAEALARGHRLRDGFRPAPARDEHSAVAIVGAGIAGLSAAWTLERAGLRDFVVLELEDAPGGTAQSGHNDVSAYPWAAHYVPVPSPDNRALVALLDEVGAVAGRDSAGRPVYAEEALCRDPQERVFFRGEWYEGLYPRVAATPEDLRQLGAFEAEMRRWAEWRDARGRRAFALPRATGSDDPRVRDLDRGSMAAWMRSHGFSSERLLWFVEYACRDDFGATLRQTSAWAGIHYFASRLETPEAESAPFLTWPEGNGRLVRHLSEVATPARLRTGALVTDVAPHARGVDVTWFDTRAGETVRLRAEHAVFALPRFLAGPLVAPWRQAPPAFLRETTYGAWIVANLTLRARPAARGFPPAWDNVLYDSPSLGYVTATHQLGRDHGPTVLTYYLADTSDDVRAARRRLLATPWEAWTRSILDDLAPAHPDLEQLVERIDVRVWGHAMVRPRPGSCFSEALTDGSKPLGRLHFAHTDLAGVALFEEAQYYGVRAAEMILRARSAAPAPWQA
jgi:phytoene dehydrogenase-like protein